MKSNTVSAVTHLNFRGQARDALNFYQSVFGGEVMAMTYKDFGQVTNEEEADQLIWGQVVASNGFRIMAYDVPSATPYHPGQNAFLVALETATPEQVSAYWDKIANGATITVPLAPAEWAPLFGMLTDRFGTNWSLSVGRPQND
jgi:PhnB protein